MGPFQESPFFGPVKISPLSTTEKKDSTDRQVILDLSFPEGRSVNSGIPIKEYLGSAIDLWFSTVDDMSLLIMKKGIFHCGVTVITNLHNGCPNHHQECNGQRHLNTSSTQYIYVYRGTISTVYLICTSTTNKTGSTSGDKDQGIKKK